MSQRSRDETAALAAHFDTPDPRYYSVEELDVLPIPREPIRSGKNTGSFESGSIATGSISTGSIRTVQLLAQIDASGRIVGLSALGSDTEQTQLAAALHALSGTSFKAARKDGQPVRSEVVIELTGGSDMATGHN